MGSKLRRLLSLVSPVLGNTGPQKRVQYRKVHGHLCLNWHTVGLFRTAIAGPGLCLLCVLLKTDPSVKIRIVSVDAGTKLSVLFKKQDAFRAKRVDHSLAPLISYTAIPHPVQPRRDTHGHFVQGDWGFNKQSSSHCYTLGQNARYQPNHTNLFSWTSETSFIWRLHSRFVRREPVRVFPWRRYLLL